MDILNDPGAKEIIDDFCSESLKLFGQLEDLLSILEENPSKMENLEKFGQVIDRVMGAAKTLGFEDISNFCELGKIIGYKSAQTNDVALVPVIVAILFDAVDLLKKMVHQIGTGKLKALEGVNLKAFGTRLKWLSEKFKNIDRASCNNEKRTQTSGGGQGNMAQASIDDLLESLGL